MQRTRSPTAEAYAWFTAELANLRNAFRWAADHDDLDVAAAIAACAPLLGTDVGNLEPIAWADELADVVRTTGSQMTPYPQTISCSVDRMPYILKRWAG